MVAMRINSKAGYKSNIMLICNEFKEFGRTIWPTNAHWADFMGYENGTSTSISWVSGDITWDSVSTITRQDLSGLV